MKSLLLKLIKLLVENYKVLATLSVVIIILSYLLTGIVWLKNNIVIGDVICVLDDNKYKELSSFIQKSYSEGIKNYFADSEKMEEDIKRYSEKFNDKSNKKDKLKFIESFVPFVISDFYVRGDDIIFLYIENQKSKPIQKVKIKVPTIWHVFNVKIISNALTPNEIAKIEKSWSLNEDSRVLFFEEIKEMPSNSYLKIYIQGSGHPSIFDKTTFVTYEGGKAKEHWLKPEYISLRRLAQYTPPSMELFILIAVLVIIIYQTLRNIKTNNKSH
jgi:hypothetical protein